MMILLTASFFTPYMLYGASPIPAPKNSLVIGFGGDTMIGRMVNKVLMAQSAAYPWGNVLPLLKKNDINIINSETTLTTHTQAVPKVFNFKSDPKNVAVLQAGHITVVSLANNHSLDFGNEGLRETIITLDAAGIQHVGAGTTIDQARKPVIITKNGITIGILGFTDNEPTWKATHKNPGIHYISVGDINAIKQDIQKLRNKVDIIIATIHWGPNMQQEPTKKFQQFAHQLIDTGVDIIHGHSAHIFQGIEIYKNKVIMYDTGDFVDDYATDPLLRNDQTFLYQLYIQKSNSETKITHIQLIPLIISNMQVNQAIGAEKPAILKKMRQLSAKFGTFISNDGIIFVK